MNQLQALDTLEKSKFTKAQAKALLNVLGDLEDRAVTKADLRVLKAEPLVHIYSAAGVVVATLSFIKFFQ